MTLRNRSAVTTGATGGLGSVVTHTLAEQGANLALLDINPDKLAAMANSIDLPEPRFLTRPQELKGIGVTANLLQAKTIDLKRVMISSPSPYNACSTTPEEQTSGIMYLLTEDAAMVNGENIPLYGS